MSNHQYKSSHHRHSDGGGNHRKSGVTWVKVGTNPINAISLCEDNNRVVIAGRSLLKVFTYDENKCKFSETVNLQVGRREVSFYFIQLSWLVFMCWARSSLSCSENV